MPDKILSQWFSNGYNHYVKRFPSFADKSSYSIKDSVKWEPEPELPFGSYAMHYFIDDLEPRENGLQSTYINIFCGENYTWSDIDFFGKHSFRQDMIWAYPILHCTGTEPISKIMTICGAFPSGSAAKQAGWLKPIPMGYSEVTIGKGGKRREFVFYRPSCRYPQEIPLEDIISNSGI